jgi:hypothetical protein
VNSKVWKDLELIFSHLREEDMSSDDTDLEGTFYAGKVVRRVRKFWISTEVTKVSVITWFHGLSLPDTPYRYSSSTATIAQEPLVVAESVDPVHCRES